MKTKHNKNYNIMSIKKILNFKKQSKYLKYKNNNKTFKKQQGGKIHVLPIVNETGDIIFNDDYTNCSNTIASLTNLLSSKDDKFKLNAQAFMTHDISCICPLYNFTVFVEKNTNIDSFILKDLFGNIILYRNINQDNNYEFQLDKQFIIHYNGKINLTQEQIKAIQKENTYENFLNKTYANYGKNMSVAISHYFKYKNLWYDYYYKEPLDKFVSNLFHKPQEDNNYIFQNKLNIVSIMIFFNLFKELQDIVDAEPKNFIPVEITEGDKAQFNILQTKQQAPVPVPASAPEQAPAPELAPAPARNTAQAQNKTKKIQNKAPKPILNTMEDLHKFINDIIINISKKDLSIDLNGLEKVYTAGFESTTVLNNIFSIIVKNIEEKSIDDTIKNNFYFETLVGNNNVIENFIKKLIINNKDDKDNQNIQNNILALIPSALKIIKDTILSPLGEILASTGNVNRNGNENEKRIREAYNYIMYGCNYLNIASAVQIFQKQKSGVQKSDDKKFIENIKRYTGVGKIRIDDKFDKFEYNYIYFMKLMIDFLIITKQTRQTYYRDFLGSDLLIKEIMNIYYLNFIQSNTTTKKIFPISITNHITKYLKDNILFEETLKSTMEQNLKSTFKIFTLISISIDVYSYVTCAETTVYNLLIYLLSDTTGQITKQNIDILNTNFSNNKVKKYFNDELLQNENIILALEKNLSDFNKSLVELPNIEYMQVRKYEVIGRFNNFIKVVLAMLGIEYDNTVENNKIAFIEAAKKFGKNFTVTIDGLDNEDISFYNTGAHIEINKKQEYKINTWNLDKINHFILNKYQKKYKDINIKNINGPYAQNIIPLNLKSFRNLIISDKDRSYNSNTKIKEHLLNYQSVYPLYFNPEEQFDNIPFLFKIIIKKITFNQIQNISSLANCKEIIFDQNCDFNQPLVDGLFPMVEKITFGSSFNSNIAPNALSNCKEIIFDQESIFNKPLVDRQFPMVEKITFGSSFNSNIAPNALSNCKEIIFDQESIFDMPLRDRQFPMVEKITFGKSFNSNIAPNALSNCKEIIFDQKSIFDMPLRDRQFPMVEKITFGKSFNSNIAPNALPKCKEIIFDQENIFDMSLGDKQLPMVEKITFGKSFNSNIAPNALSNCKEIIFYQDSIFNQELVDGQFPMVETFKFNPSFNSNIAPNALPKCKEIIFFPYTSSFNKPLIDRQFPMVEKITFSNSFNSNIAPNALPKCKEIIFDQESIFNKQLEDEQFPMVEKITFGKSFNSNIAPNALPKCKKIFFSHNFDKPLVDGQFPKVEKITFGHSFKSNIAPSALLNCKEIFFSHDFDKPLVDGQFPMVEKITFGKSFNSNIAPNALLNCKEIIFSDYSDFDFPLVDGQFPMVEKITFGKGFNSNIALNALPNCKEINFNSIYGKFDSPIDVDKLTFLKKMFQKNVIINYKKGLNSDSNIRKYISFEGTKIKGFLEY